MSNANWRHFQEMILNIFINKLNGYILCMPLFTKINDIMVTVILWYVSILITTNGNILILIVNFNINK